MWATPTTIYSWNGTGSTTTANETGGTAEAKGGNSNVVVGTSQKGNWCFKLGKGFQNTNYIEITLNKALDGGETVTLGTFVASSTAVFGIDFGTTATQTLHENNTVLANNGTPDDWEITVPAEASGSKKIRVYRNSGSSTLYVSKLIVTEASSGSGTNATWTMDPTTATVTAGQSTTLQLTTNYDGTLNFISNDTEVATVSFNTSTKVVTVNGIAPGSTTISVTGDATATYNAINKTIVVTVDHAELANNMADVMGGFGYSYFSLSPEGNNTFAQPEVATTTITDIYGITMTIAKAESQTYPRYDATYMRFYKSNTLTITAPIGCYITKVVFTEPASGAEWKGTMNVTTGDYDNTKKTWYATETDVTELVFTGKDGNNRIGGLKVYLQVSSTMPTISAAGYATFSFPLAIDFSGATAMKVYTAQVNGESVTLSEVASKKVPANTGVVLSGDAGRGEVIEDIDALANNDLLVSDGTKKGDDLYVLANKNSTPGFYLLSNTVTIPKGKCYLDLSGATAPEFLGFSFGGEVTGVNEVSEVKEVNDNSWYNLAGQRVAQPTKGLYIVNGKKVVIK